MRLPAARRATASLELHSDAVVTASLWGFSLTPLVPSALGRGAWEAADAVETNGA